MQLYEFRCDTTERKHNYQNEAFLIYLSSRYNVWELFWIDIFKKQNMIVGLTHDDLDLVSSDRLDGLQVIGRDRDGAVLVRQEDRAHTC